MAVVSRNSNDIFRLSSTVRHKALQNQNSTQLNNFLDFDVLVANCIDTFKSDPRYRNDVRFLKIGSSILDYKRVFKEMKEHILCTKKALISFALFMEQGRFIDAFMIHQLGMYSLLLRARSLLLIPFHSALPILLCRQRGIYLPSSSRNTYLLTDKGCKILASDSKPSCLLSEMGVTILLIIGTITLIVIRISYVVYCTGKPRSGKPLPPLSTLIMEKFKPRYYVAAATDSMSLQKARLLEDSLMDKILCNGPGTCIPLCMIAFIFKVLGVRWSSILYIESIARVRRLSLSGLLLYKLHMADQLFVQWPQLKSKYPRANYLGRL
ncbi:UDP-N-acetylglucosamine transferase subunit ALG 14, partial [Striga asiatica]